MQFAHKAICMYKQLWDQELRKYHANKCQQHTIKCLPYYSPFLHWVQWSPAVPLTTGQLCGALMFPWLLCTWTKFWKKITGELLVSPNAFGLYDITVMCRYMMPHGCIWCFEHYITPLKLMSRLITYEAHLCIYLAQMCRTYQNPCVHAWPYFLCPSSA